MAGSQCAIKGPYRSNLCTGKWTNNAVQHRGEILAQTSLHPDPGPHNDPQTHHISQQSFVAIQPDAEATSHFVSLEQLLSAAIHKTLKNAYRHADFNIRSNIGNLYFLETCIIKHKDKILGALAIFIEDSARQKIYSDRPNGAFGAHSGLGLSISKKIIEAHGGVIWAENITSKFSTGEESDILWARLLVGLPRVCCSSSNHIGIT